MSFTILPQESYVVTQMVNGVWTDAIRFKVTSDAGACTRGDAIAALRSWTDGSGNTYDYGSVHPDPYFPSLIVVGYQFITQDAPDTYTIQVNYANANGMQLPENNNLAAYPATISYSYAFRQEPIEHESVPITSNGTTYYPITNSAGSPFDPPPTHERVSLIMSVVRYKDSFDPISSMSYVGNINSDSVTIVGVGTMQPRTMRCLNFAPPSSYIPTVYLNYSNLVGTFVAGESVTVGSASGLFLGFSGSQIILMNPVGTFVSGTTMTGASSGATATNERTYITPKIPILFQFEIRPEGFKMHFRDEGYDAYYNKSGGGIGRARISYKNGPPVSSPVLLHDGAPIETSLYEGVDRYGNKLSDFSSWCTSNSQIPTDVTTETVTLPNSLSCDFILWRNWGEKSFADIGA